MKDCPAPRVAYCRAGRGPALVHGHVVRPYSHSLSDDERQYRSEAEVAAENARDPLGKDGKRMAGSLPAGHYSILIGVNFQSFTGTLRDEELQGYSDAVVAALESLGGKQRG